jgi:hypothetical protein
MRSKADRDPMALSRNAQKHSFGLLDHRAVLGDFGNLGGDQVIVSPVGRRGDVHVVAARTSCRRQPGLATAVL